MNVIHCYTLVIGLACPITYCKLLFTNNVVDDKKQKKITNKCVSRADTNPPFAFNIAFSRAQVSRGFYRGYRDG